MNTQLTDMTIILDRSGSMQSVAADTIGGFNRFLEDQRKGPGQATLTLNQFDDVFERVIDARDIQQAPPLTEEIGWEPEISIERTLQDLLDYWRHRVAHTPRPA